MAGFNFSSHGSQDLYPTMLTKQYHFSEDKSTVVNVCANLGALAGVLSLVICLLLLEEELLFYVVISLLVL